METETTQAVEYRTLDEYPGYRFGSDGSVWSKWKKGPKKEGFSKFKETWTLLKQIDNSGGYFIVNLHHKSGSIKRSIPIHVLILSAFVSAKPHSRLEGCHNNGNRHDNRKYNLRWDSRQGNARDAIKHGTIRRGNQIQTCKLTPQDVLKIRRALVDGESVRTIAVAFGMHEKTIADIQDNKIWKWVHEDNQ